MVTGAGGTDHQLSIAQSQPNSLVNHTQAEGLDRRAVTATPTDLHHRNPDHHSPRPANRPHPRSDNYRSSDHKDHTGARRPIRGTDPRHHGGDAVPLLGAGRRKIRSSDPGSISAGRPQTRDEPTAWGPDTEVVEQSAPDDAETAQPVDEVLGNGHLHRCQTGRSGDAGGRRSGVRPPARDSDTRASPTGTPAPRQDVMNLASVPYACMDATTSPRPPATQPDHLSPSSDSHHDPRSQTVAVAERSGNHWTRYTPIER